jgi:hypothetical protein
MSKTNQQLRLATGRRLANDESFSENGTTCSGSLSPAREQSWNSARLMRSALGHVNNDRLCNAAEGGWRQLLIQSGQQPNYSCVPFT